MRWICLALLLVLSMNAGATELWRWVDENGVVHYSDRPHPGAERIELQRVQSFTPPPMATRDVQPEDSRPSQDRAGSPYTGLRIVSPGEEETLWNIGGELSVEVALQPALRAGHTLRVQLDGDRVVELPPGQTRITIDEVFRGEHRLRASVVDDQGRELVSSDPVVFFVQQASILNPNNPANRPQPPPRPTPRSN